MCADRGLCLPLPVFVVETTEVVELGDFFEVLRQFVQLPVFISVQVGLHEWSDLITNRKLSCIILEMTSKSVDNEDDATDLQSVLWIHKEVPSNVVKHDGVPSVVKVFVLPPYHTKRLHLNMTIPEKQ